MSQTPHQRWRRVQEHLKKINAGFVQDEPGGALTLELENEDWQLEVTPAGVLTCQAGYALEDVQSLLSDGTAEDLGGDELAKQAKFYVQQIVSKHSNGLKRDGFTERVDMNEEYVAVLFERAIDLDDLPGLEQLITRYQRRFSAA